MFTMTPYSQTVGSGYIVLPISFSAVMSIVGNSTFGALQTRQFNPPNTILCTFDTLGYIGTDGLDNQIASIVALGV